MSGRSSRDFRALWPWSLCVLAAASSLVVARLLTPMGHVPDFASYYFAAQEAAAGEDVYNAHTTHRMYPYMYPPFFAVALRPLTLFALDTALIIWNLLQVVLGAVVLWLTSRILRHFSLSSTWPVAVASLLCTWVFILNIVWAQANMVVVALSLLAVWLTLCSRPLFAGLVLGIAVSIKVTPVCVLLVASLLRPRDIVIVVTSCAATVFACCFLVPAAFVDLSWALSMNQRFFAFSARSTTGIVDILPFGNNRLNQSLAFGYGAWAIFLPLLAAVITAASALRRDRPAVQPIVVAQAFVITPLISPIAWGHHWFALLPALAIVTAIRRQSALLMLAWLGLALAVVVTFFVGELPATTVPTLAMVAAALLAGAAAACRK